jgi:GTP-binding protein
MASTESRDPYQDYLTIKHELEAYNPELLKRPQVIVANKMDQDEAQLFLAEFKARLEDDYPIFELSALTHDNLDKFIYKLSEILDNTPKFPLFSEKDDYKVYLNTNEDFCKVKFEDGFYVVYGGPVEAAFYRTNFSTDAGVLKFMRILRYNGVEEKLKAAGIKDGDSVKICDYEFDYFE